MYAPFIKDWEETRANKGVQPMTNFASVLTFEEHQKGR